METVIRGGDDLETFTRSRRCGFAGVEVVLERDQLRSPGQERVAALARASEATELAIPSLVLGDHNAGGLGDEHSDVRQAAREDVLRAIDWARALGVDVILVPFFLQGELLTEAHVERATRALAELCPIAAEREVTLCFEGTLPAAGVRKLAADVGWRGFGCYFDLANPLVRGMDTATEARALGNLVRRVHLKDTRVRGGDCPPGLGRVDFGESVRALSEIGYDDWLVFETPVAPEEMVRRDLSFARTVFPGLQVRDDWPRLGAFSYDFPAGAWEHLASTFAAYGLDVVQLGGELLDECVTDPSRIDAGVDTLRAQGISVAALAGYRNLVARDAGARAASLARLTRCLEIAPRFGTRVVATESGTKSPAGDWTDSSENWSATAWSSLLDALERLLPVAERSGTILALEAHTANVLKTPGQALALLDRFPTPHLQLVCDPYNYISAHLLEAHERLTADLLDRFEHRFVLAHLKDVAPGGDGVRTPEFGTGVFAQRPYLEFLRARRPDLPLILEHLPLQHIPAAIDRLTSAITEPTST